MIFSILPSPDTSLGPTKIQVALGVCLRSLLGSVFARISQKRLNKLRRGKFKPSWKLLNNRLNERLALPFIMYAAPRWNTHACILTAGPFGHSGGSLSFSGISPGVCRAWSLVIYEAESGETVGLISSGNDMPEIDLAAGHYGAGLRLYQAEGLVEIPPLSDSQGTLVPELTIDPDSMVPLEDTIFGRDGLFYRLLNAPAQARLFAVTDPADKSAADVYLPVGNPETLFIFGALPRQRRLMIDAANLPKGTLCYLTTYNSASFPLQSEVVHSNVICEVPPESKEGSFLLRIVPYEGTAAKNQDILDKIQISLAA